METQRKRIQASRFKSVCVFCGSSPGNKQSYQLAAIELGRELVKRDIDLVYGGGSIGLMGLVSQSVYDGGRHVLGVIPKTLLPAEVKKRAETLQWHNILGETWDADDALMLEMKEAAERSLQRR